MKQATTRRNKDTVLTTCLVGTALAVGALFGGMLVLIFSALPTEPAAKPPSAVVGDASIATEVRPTVAEGDGWHSAPYRPVGVGETKTLDNSLSPTTFSTPAQRLPVHLHGPLDLAIVTLLGVCLAGMGTAVVVLHRENTRLEERMRRFEELAKKPDRDWLANLDAALEGEWNDEE